MSRKTWPLLALLVLTAQPLYAAEEGGGPLDINVGLIIWTFLIFGIVLAVLAKFAWPNILGAVERREAHIRELLEGAERDRAEAATLAEENRRLMEDTRAKVQDALNDARAQNERVRADALAESRRQQDEMMERARRDIAAERAAALESVRHEAVDLSIAAAERLVRRTLDSEDNRRLVREYLGQVSPRATAGV
ncbi:F0F1 ATP synthase subunit B [Longimicrobium terrae]|uniref:ATP synthase subunit b n=1 Tax=Longimicrobium terrae TaxID=1639882 RepID=A0A841H1Z3_9BACT|nr:F0F1 ATP synthase subunit B [Longimicrobium terrae]MBB4637605.1 F-type H+-transporting ATPase subunit b [Longimicrobium terrae]MBB6072002.1 F-type H+-transporting ATPase subunit b [Longimicrobium terrae]NNC29911.1 F0F1 ATP synthase subunit B [Longimicrobium terrae]